MTTTAGIDGGGRVRASHQAMTLIVVIMSLASLFVGEHVQTGHGLGWDGITYARLVRSLDRLVAERGLDTYYAQRCLPAAIVRGILLVLGRRTPTDADIITTFAIYNAVLAVAATLLWRRIADQLALGVGARWIGFSALFMKYAFAKQDFFYPVLTDLTAYVAGLLLLLLSIKRQRTALLAVTVLAAFAWPIAALSGGMLLLLLHLPGDVLWDDGSTGRLWRSHRHAIMAASAVIVAAYLVAAALVASGVACSPLNGMLAGLATRLPGAVQAKLARADACVGAGRLLTAIPTLLLFSAAAAWLALAGLQVRRIGCAVRHVRALDVVASAMALVLPWIGIRLLANSSLPTVSNPLLLARLSLFPPDGMVFMPLVSLGVFWGPMLLLVVLHWRKVAVAARRIGPGVVALLCLNISFGVVGEPRFITLAWPFLVTAAVSALDGQPPSRRFGHTFALLSILFAQFWLPLNYVPWSGNDYDQLLVLPKQLYFMHYGLWMSRAAYALQGMALLITGVWLWTAGRSRTPQGCTRLPAR